MTCVNKICRKPLDTFWQNCLDETAIIIQGACYHDGGKGYTNPNWNGFGGARFVIQFLDGRIVQTANLRCNGKIPKEYQIKDNAKFIWRKEV